MKLNLLDDILIDYGSDYLVCDAAHPLISNSNLSEEAMLYNLSSDDICKVIAAYNTIVNKNLLIDTPLDQLSGGQKVMLMVILALQSTAASIAFVNVDNSLDLDHKTAIHKLVESARQHKADIRIFESL